MKHPKLFMLLLGCKPAGRHTEQHDIFFGIARELKELIPAIYEFWPEAKEKIHVDAWREVTKVGEYAIRVTGKKEQTRPEQLFFINLGGYKQNEFDESHYKLLAVAPGKGEAIQQAKQTAFYKHTGFEGAPSHLDDKYGVDVDDIFEIEEILPARFVEQYSLVAEPATIEKEDEIHLGYFTIARIAEM